MLTHRPYGVLSSSAPSLRPSWGCWTPKSSLHLGCPSPVAVELVHRAPTASTPSTGVHSSAHRGLPHAVPPPPEGQQPAGAPGGFRPGWGEPFPRGLRARQQLSPSPRGAGGSWGCNRMSDRSRSENLLHAGISRFASSSCPPWKPRRGGGRWQRVGGNLSLASRTRGADEGAACCCSWHPRARAPFTPRRRHFPVSAPHLSAERKSHLMQTKVV